MKLSNKIITLICFLPVLLLFNQVILRGYISAPLDLVVGIYHPFRDNVVNGKITDIPFRNSLLADVVSIIIPWREFGVKTFLDHSIPLWNPYSAASSPLFANFQSAIFYPFNILLIVLASIFKTPGFIFGWNLYIFAIPLLSLVFTFLFLKNKKITDEASLLGAIVFAFSGFMMTWLEYGVIGHAILWLPLILLFVDKIVLENKNKFLPFISIATALSILAGYPQASIYVLSSGGLYGLFTSLTLKRPARLKLNKIVLVLSSIILGIILSGVQIIPSLELLMNSIRGVDEGLGASKDFGFLPLQNFVTLLFPDVFGNPATGNFSGLVSYNDVAFYTGILPILLSLVAVFKVNKTETKFYLLLAAMAIILSTLNPFSKFVHTQLPGLSGGVPSRALLLFDFSMAILSAFGLDIIIKKNSEKNSQKYLWMLSLPLLLIILFFWVVVLKKMSPYIEPFSQNIDVARRNLVLPTIIFISGLSVIFLQKINRIPQKIHKLLPLMLVGIISFELIRQGIKYNSFSPQEYFYPATGITDFLQKDTQNFRVLGTIPNNMNLPYRLMSPETYDALVLKRYSEFIGIINNQKALPGSRYTNIFDYKSRLVDLLGVKYYIFNFPAAKEGLDHYTIGFPLNKYKIVYQSTTNQIYENLTVLPRAFIVYNYKVLSDDNKIAQELLSPGFDLSKEVILEKEIPLAKHNNDENIKNSVIIQEYKPNNITLKTNSPEKGLLFLSDNYYPGWIAKVDGIGTPIYRADFTFRAIIIPKGEHKIEFLYQPLSLKIGLLLSLSALSIILVEIKILNGKRKTYGND